MSRSYLKDIISEQLDVNAISRKISTELLALREKLHLSCQENHLNFEPLLKENNKLLKRAAGLTKRQQTVRDAVAPNSKKLDECLLEILDSISSIEKNDKILKALDQIETIYTNLDKSAANLKLRLFYECSCSVKNAQRALEEAGEMHSLGIVQSLNQETVSLRERLLFEMTEVWSMAVRFSIEKNVGERLVTIDINTSLLTDVRQIIRAFYSANDHFIIQKFFKKVEENVMLPIILHECSGTVESTGSSAKLVIVVEERSKPSDYKIVFEHVLKVVAFLKAHLNVSIEDHGDFIELMGLSMAKEITSSLVKNCLSDAIPAHSGQNEGCSQIVSNAEKFQNELQKLGFFPANFSSFLKENEDTGLFFANKMYLSYLDRARNVVKGDLHYTQKSSELQTPDLSLLPPPISKEIRTMFNISRNPNANPTLIISKSAQEVLDLVDTVLEELHKSDGDRALRLLYTIRNIFEIYTAVVPIHHRKLLGSLPQQVAVFHNNCLLFVNRLLLLGCECRQWQAELRSHYHAFFDEAVAMRKLAVNSLEVCVANQRSLMIAILYDSGLSNLREKAELGADTERSVRQCIRQLQLLRSVWVEVLPDSVYANSMGFLIDELTKTIIQVIVEAEDISAQAANQLLSILGIVEERLPKLFNEPKEVFRLSRKWDRFLNLIFVLGSNLEKISERWASGLGPLAHAFSKAEAQSLVRALFRNTERRAAVLSQISKS